MTETQDYLLEDSIEIAAPPAKVWSLVSDIPAMARWSPQVVRSKVKGGAVREGARFTNVNRDKLLFWPTNGKVVRFVPEREIAFRIKENKTVWSFRLEPTDTGGTRVVQRREAPDGVSEISTRLVNVALGGQEEFTRKLREGMRQTLERIKVEAES
ncbi:MULTISPECIES: SRPBCC family protein [Nocardioides]|uniref:SRPBCC family protein n=1 Tax=Nocardioides vastitatis TaxID=2568655 RepID=A0ABW0ZNP4_9ACTN|nr:SRPBCC family protein [Nocardioides sp.]THI96735.1 SRPBCC family protein [Nocardioides sp.]